MRVLFFGKLQDMAGTERLDIGAAHISSLTHLIDHLEKEHPALRGTLSGESVRAAINGEMAKPDHPVKQGDEIAFLPPVSGG